MKVVLQQDFSGCAVACLASILNVSYRKALNSFDSGKEKAKFRGFLCKEIILALKRNGLNYCLKYVGRRKINNYPVGTIISIKKNPSMPIGHYLCCTKKGWMDSWINFPRLKARGGFRKRLPGKPVYALFPDFSINANF